MYSILRIQKIKTRSQLSASQNHNLRLKPVANADPNKTHLNKTVLAKSYKELVGELEDRFNKFNINPRKDAVQAVEVVLSASPEFFKDIHNQKLQEWINENYKWAKSEFGENLLQFNLHLDELTPHFHLIFTPITKNGRLSMKELYGGKAKLSALQTRYAEAMSKFGLKRGIQGNKAEHTTIKEFYSLNNKLKTLKPNQIKKIAEQLEIFEIENNTLVNQETTITTDYETMLKKIATQQEPKPKIKTKNFLKQKRK